MQPRPFNEHLEVVKMQYAHLRELWISDVNRSSGELEVQVLIGADYLWQFQKGETIRGGIGEPVAVETTLGWVLSGPMKCSFGPDVEQKVKINLIVETSQFHKDLNENVSKLWDLETLGIKEEVGVQEEFLDNISFNGERYVVKLPWKVGHGSLPSNYASSLSRLRSLQKKLKSEPDILKEYSSVISGQLKEGVVEKVAELNTPGHKVHYLPHHAVVRRAAQTTKVRVVYDASCKSGKSSASLNDCLHVGPSLNPLLFDILVRFRMNRVVLIADIEKAFLNVEVSEGDRDSLRFLWMEDPTKCDTKVLVYRFCRVVFGLNASPFLLNATLRHHLSRYEAIDPDFVRKMINSFYVDDLVTGENSANSSFDLYEKSRDRLAEGGFRLRKWLSNDQDLLRRIRAEENKNSLGNLVESDELTYAKTTLGACEGSGNHKVLGLLWDQTRDIIKFSLSDIATKADKLKATKRNLLSLVAGIFDPLGMISPIVVELKVLFQSLCVSKVGWDEELIGSDKKQWDDCISDLGKTEEIVVDRCVYNEATKEEGEWCLHGFSDASKVAYCAVVYILHRTIEGVKVTLLVSKTRVAPLKQLSIPRLELMGTRILAKLMDSVKRSLVNQVEISETVLWTDSITVLYWLQNRGVEAVCQAQSK